MFKKLKNKLKGLYKNLEESPLRIFVSSNTVPIEIKGMIKCFNF